MFQSPLTGDTGDGQLVTQGDLSHLLLGYVTDGQLAQTETNIAANTAGIGANAAAISALESSLSSQLASKANASDLGGYAPLSSLSSLGSQADVAAAQASAAAAEASVQVLAASTTASLNEKASASALEALQGEVAGKLSSSELSASLSGYTTSSQLDAALAASRATTLAHVSGTYASQALVTDVSVALSQKASQADITSALQEYSTSAQTQSMIDSSVLARASAQATKDAEQDALIASKASASELAVLQGRVDQQDVQLASKASQGDVSTAVSGLASEAWVSAQLSAATNNLATTADLASKAQASAVTQLESDLAQKLSAASLSSTLQAYATVSSLAATQAAVDQILANQSGGGGGGAGSTSIQFVNLQSAPPWDGHVTYPLVVPNSSLPVVRSLHLSGSLTASIQNSETVLSLACDAPSAAQVDSSIAAALVPYNLQADHDADVATLTTDLAAANASITQNAADVAAIQARTEYEATRIFSLASGGQTITLTVEFTPGAVRIDKPLTLTQDLTAPNIYSKVEVDGLLAGLVDGAPAAMDTLKELSEALGNDTSRPASPARSRASRPR